MKSSITGLEFIGIFVGILLSVNSKTINDGGKVEKFGAFITYLIAVIAILASVCVMIHLIKTKSYDPLSILIILYLILAASLLLKTTDLKKNEKELVDTCLTVGVVQLSTAILWIGIYFYRGHGTKISKK